MYVLTQERGNNVTKYWDLPNRPKADRPGLYGCCHCGNYRALDTGELLRCDNCRCRIAMVYIDDSYKPVEQDLGRK